MKKKYIFLSVLATAVSVTTLSSCDDYLDTMPDNRTVLDTEDKMSDLLTSSYPAYEYALVNELMSDNADYYGAENPNGGRLGDQIYFWKDVTESPNEAPSRLWSSCYNCIANVNQVLESLKEYKFSDDKAQQLKAEALLCRAYAHFILVNEFGLAYNTKTSTKDLGVPLSTKVEKITAKHERASVAAVYEQIDKDLQEALPLVGDNYKVPKYHFNVKAAYAFATRFYLFYEKWDEAIKYADLCLGGQRGPLRDWSVLGSMADDNDALINHYISADLGCNLMFSDFYSSSGIYLGAYVVYKRYSHGRYLGANEDILANNVWGSGGYYKRPLNMAGANFDICLFNKMAYKFQYTDPVAQTGYRRLTLPLFTTDEVLLSRAEALIMKKQYDKACEDLNAWMHNIVKTTVTLTPTLIQNFYNSVNYCYDDVDHLQSTVKKHLHPAFDIDAEGSVQETMLQCVLGFRRIETVQEGKRWWDIKRYGIEIPRREMDASGQPSKVLDVLKKDDPRRAVQIPLPQRNAGVQPNPRNGESPTVVAPAGPLDKFLNNVTSDVDFSNKLIRAPKN